MNCKVSIIIPIYNVKPYLRECLDSVERQTLEDIEIICIDDGSTDGSLEILQEYTRLDTRVRVLVNEENRGQAYTRNIGLQEATGTYVYFMDSDDWIDADAMEALVARADDERLDLLFFALQAFSDTVDAEELQRKWAYRRVGTYRAEASTGAELFEVFVKSGDYFVNLPGVLMRRQFLLEHKIALCTTLRAYEDNLLVFQAILQAKRVMCIPMPYYHRRVRPGSVMTTAFSVKNVQAYLLLYEALCKWTMQIPVPVAGSEAVAIFITDIHRQLEDAIGKVPGAEKEAAWQTLFEAYEYERASKKASKVRRETELVAQLRAQSEKLVVIYGAGDYGRRLACSLDAHGISEFVFAVTNPGAAGTYRLGQRVHCIDEFLAQGDRNCQIVIAANEVHGAEMAAYLKAHGMEDFLMF